MAKIYFPNPMTVSYPPSPEEPSGVSVPYAAGWNEIDDGLIKSHPMLLRMVGNDMTREREERLHAAEQEYRDKVNAADRDLAVARMEANNNNAEENAKLSQDWADRREAALEKGLPFNEPHPDREQAISDALTASPGQQAVTPRAMQSEIMDAPADIRERQRAQRDSVRPGDSGEAVGSPGPVAPPARVAPPKPSDKV